jgi:acetylornithine deacetylase
MMITRAATEVLRNSGQPPTVAPMSYWADSAFLSTAGIPTVLYGPEGEGAHADIEWVSRSGTRTTTTVLTRLAQDFCS